MRIAAGIGCALVASGVAGAQGAVPPADVEQGVAIFRAACIDAAPGFETSEAAFGRSGMARLGDDGMFASADRAVLGIVGIKPGRCTVRLPASDPAAVAAALRRMMAEVWPEVEPGARMGYLDELEPGWTWRIGGRRVAVALVDDAALGPILTVSSEGAGG